MSTRVSTNIAKRMRRQLPLRFNTSASACFTTDPNTFNSNTPSENDAMGVSDTSGIVSIVHDAGATKQLTLWYWDKIVNHANSAKGWIKLGPTSSIYTASADPFALFSFTAPENCPIFVTADAAITNMFMSIAKHPAQALPDLQ